MIYWSMSWSMDIAHCWCCPGNTNDVQPECWNSQWFQHSKRWLEPGVLPESNQLPVEYKRLMVIAINKYSLPEQRHSLSLHYFHSWLVRSIIYIAFSMKRGWCIPVFIYKCLPWLNARYRISMSTAISRCKTRTFLFIPSSLNIESWNRSWSTI